MSVLVHVSSEVVSGHSDHFTAAPGSDNSGSLPSSASQSRISPHHGLEAPWLNPMELACSDPVREVLLGSRKMSARTAYLAKWKRFTIWSLQKHTSPTHSIIPFILNYFLHLKQQGPSMLSIKVHLAAISAFHRVMPGQLVFTSLVVGHFLKGLDRLYPQV